MEATKEGTGLINNILPPRLEDAGLEDCALPPDSIKEAYLRAASAVSSRASTLFHDDDDDDDDDPASCVDDPWPAAAKDAASDTVVGVPLVPEAPGQCGVLKGDGVVEEGEDKVVVVVGGDLEEGEGGDGCVEGLKGLSIEEEDKKEKEEKESEKPTLIEGPLSISLCQARLL
ncbi:hypothetical protein Dsin_013753 [Dipteronia sinensis]|uniref:Uncharacterized protein n=1 Tax=Dipteronia sinensis TaxID=43782 RepID=A0AAE0AL20_9ROSI|nr:hypothetical protein Dsin_013753 [Dipteronia sinensis]